MKGKPVIASLKYLVNDYIACLKLMSKKKVIKSFYKFLWVTIYQTGSEHATWKIATFPVKLVIKYTFDVIWKYPLTKVWRMHNIFGILVILAEDAILL